MSEIGDLAGYNRFLADRLAGSEHAKPVPASREKPYRQRRDRPLSLMADHALRETARQPEATAPPALPLAPHRNWQDDASCQPELLPKGYSIDDFTSSVAKERERAKDICAGNAKKAIAPCPVAAYCLQHALDNDEKFGIWGGLDEDERKRLRPANKTV